jgi:hypothetical protein
MPDDKNNDRDRMNQGQVQKGGQGAQKGSTNIEKEDDQNDDLNNQVEDDDKITQRNPRQGDQGQGQQQGRNPQGNRNSNTDRNK